MKCQWAPFADAPFAFSFPAMTDLLPSWCRSSTVCDRTPSFSRIILTDANFFMHTTRIPRMRVNNRIYSRLAGLDFMCSLHLRA